MPATATTTATNPTQFVYKILLIPPRTQHSYIVDRIVLLNYQKLSLSKSKKATKQRATCATHTSCKLGVVVAVPQPGLPGHTIEIRLPGLRYKICHVSHVCLSARGRWGGGERGWCKSKPNYINSKCQARHRRQLNNYRSCGGSGRSKIEHA